MDRSKNSQAKAREHDLLSFLSVVVLEYDKYALDFTLLSAILKGSTTDYRSPPIEGAYFSVATADGKSLLDERAWKSHIEKSEREFPSVVAIKTPIIRGELNSSRNRRIWTSMAVELQILKNQHLFKHPNVISLLGVCWRSFEDDMSNLMPTFVLEAADMDLETFTVPGKPITRRKILGLAIDVVAGVQAVHEAGIIHCDIKPKNVLIFEDEDLGFKAKIADFGCAMFLSSVQGKVQAPGGTGFWQAPECNSPLEGQELMQADVYSLGLVVWNLLTANLAVTMLQAFDQGDTDSGETIDWKRDKNILGEAILMTIENEWTFKDDKRSPDIPDDFPDLKRIQYLVLRAIYLDAGDRIDIKKLHEELRIILFLVLKSEMFAPEFLNPSEDSPSKRIPPPFNSQEQDVWLKPDFEEPTDEDKERVMFFAKSREFLDQNLALVKNGSGRLIKMNQVKPESAAKHISVTLQRWEDARQIDKELQRERRNGFAVVEADVSFGTLRAIPNVVIDKLYQQLWTVAQDPLEKESRRAESAYQYAVLRIGRLRITIENKKIVEQCLEMLHLSATLGHFGSQSIIGQCYEAFHVTPAFDQDLELKWLKRGVKLGGLSAKSRLIKLDMNLYPAALEALRSRRAGCGMKMPWEYKYYTNEDFEEMLEAAPKGTRKDDPGRINLFSTFVILGRLPQVSQLLPEVDVNSSNEWNETPLLLACRTGRADIVRLLLDAGADPSIASVEGVTPLHFLAAFEDADVEDTARRLVDRGAPLEARSSNGMRYYRLTLDSTFGRKEGTPLLWAVVADSIAATKALMLLGADPFDVTAKNLPTQDGWNNIVHVSPVFFAATKHQYYLLEILLGREDGFWGRSIKLLLNTTVKHRLNGSVRSLGAQGLVDTISPLGYCITYAAEGLMWRLLLHGDEHEVAFAKTFDMLVHAGSDPSNVDGEGTSSLTFAALKGQPFVIHFLMNWNNDCLRPSPRAWLGLLVRAAGESDSTMFNTFLQYPTTEGLEAKDWRGFFTWMSSVTNDVRYVEPFREYRDPLDDFVDIFGNALVRGNFDMGKWLFTTGKCEVTTQSEGFSLLGRLINDSKVHTSRYGAIETLLDLDDLPEEVFYNCVEFNGSQLTALQLAAYHMEYWKERKANDWVIRKVVERWNEPEHFNFQVSQGWLEGFTALHIAVEGANVPAASYLLGEEAESLDLSLLDGKNRTVLDLALLSLRNQAGIMNAWDVPLEKQKLADENHWQAAIMIYMILRKAGAKGNKIAKAVVRPEGTEVHIFDGGTGDESDSIGRLGPIVVEAKKLFQMTSEELDRDCTNTMMRAAAKLGISDALFVENARHRKVSGSAQSDAATANGSAITDESREVDQIASIAIKSRQLVQTNEEPFIEGLESLHI